MAVSTKQTRQFKVDPHILVSVITAQAGSLQKAMMEAVANSMDAGATKIEVKVTSDKVTLKDDGRGLASFDEITKVFEVFGFDHSKLDRSHGRFGVGRGQLFCYGVNKWRTHTFAMEVDIQTKGFEDYDLVDNLKKVKGMTIEIDLYKPLSVREAYDLEEAFRKLVKFSVVPVVYNGKTISNDPRQTKWKEETNEAWFNLKREGHLNIYSQGLYVTSLWREGVAGDLVTKPGKAFALNLARNDILKAECQVWPLVQKKLRAVAREMGEKGDKQNTLTDSQRGAMAQEALDPENVKNLMSMALFSLTNNKHLSLTQLAKNPMWAVADAGDRRADVLNQRKSVNVLSLDTLERFGVESVGDLLARLKAVVKKAQATQNYGSGYHELFFVGRNLDKVVPHENLDAFKDLVDLDFREVSPRKLTADEKLALVVLRRMNESIPFIFMGQAMAFDDDHLKRTLRTLNVMESDSALAQTDGHLYVWINRPQLKLVKKGLDGFFRLAGLLVHEYVHTSSSQGSHLHDQNFFETFHNMLVHSKVGALAIKGLAQYAKRAKNVNSTMLSEIGIVLEVGDEALFLGDADDVLEKQEAGAETKVVVKAKPAPARRRARISG